MNATTRLYDSLAGLFTYPGGDHCELLEECHRLLAEIPDAAALVERFAERTAGLGPEGLEELYTHTFDLSPVCSLEVGWHLFGENYSRGEFLVEMRQELRRAGIEESGELPDHLSHVLGAVARILSDSTLVEPAGRPGSRHPTERFVSANAPPAVAETNSNPPGKLAHTCTGSVAAVPGLDSSI